MNEITRIYQGRVTGAELKPDEKDAPWENVSADLISYQVSENPLWSHHSIFQIAINYYVVALAALVDLDGNEILSKYRERVVGAWEVGGSGERSINSLRNSLSKFLGLPANATIEDAFKLILEGSGCSNSIRNAAVAALGEALLAKKGANNIQQLGRGEWPKFCHPNCTANFAGDPVILRREHHLKLLPWVVHFSESLAPDSTILDQFDVYSIATPNKKAPLKEGKAAKGLLKKSVENLAKKFPDDEAEFGRLQSLLDAHDGKGLSIPNYVGSSAKGEVQYRLFSLILFRYIEKSEFTLGLLKKTHPEAGSATEPEGVAVDEDAIDPLQEARGERGYVFPAFTALPAWKPETEGIPQWGEFDIAAFKMALTTLNQFQQKTDERNTQRDKLVDLRRWIDNGDEGSLKKSLASDAGDGPDDGEGEKHFTFHEDDRRGKIEELVKILQETKEEDLPPLDHGSTRKETYGVTLGTLRGLNKLSDEWNKIHRAAKGEPSVDSLESAVTELQRTDRYGIGSAPLFRKLCEVEYWDLWLEPTPKEKEQRLEKNWPRNALYAWSDYTKLLLDIQRLREPIRFTPAHPVLSRRLSMLSDYSGKSKTIFGVSEVDDDDEKDGEKKAFAEVSLVVEKNGKLEERRARLFFAARRMRRDGIAIRDKEQRWIQPMVTALGIEGNAEIRLSKDPAVALMPDGFSKAEGGETVRMLLNFPVQIDPAPIVKRIAQLRWPSTEKEGAGLENAAMWKGWNNFDNHIHWPGTHKKTKFASATALEDTDVIENGIQLVSFDIGQRNAGGYAVIEARCQGEFYRRKKPFASIGELSGNEWKACLIHSGVHKLPGENSIVYRPKTHRDRDKMTGNSFREELFGEAGRNSSEDEWKKAREMAVRLEIKSDQLEDWLGTIATDYSFPEQNDKLILIVRRAQSRLATWQRWSWKLEVNPDSALDEIKKTFAGTGDVSGDGTEEKLAELADAGKIDQLSSMIADAFRELRSVVRKELERLADRVLPLRKRKWEIKEQPDNHILLQMVPDPQKSPTKTRGQRGLSLRRIEQLEDFRRRLLSLNRTMAHQPGERATFGKRGEVPEPCPDILDKLDEIKKQRVNQTAHFVLSQALGVKLKAPSDGEKARRRDLDIHGEYEPIPQRRPADLIVIEDLNRYRSSQGRSKRENSRLMKWCHHAVLDKLKELAEPFGMPVISVQPDYSSRFSAFDGSAGFRAVEVPSFEKGHSSRHWIEKIIQRKKDSNQPISLDLQCRVKLFEVLGALQGFFHQSDGERASRNRRTLLAPQDGGPIFLSAKPGVSKPFQADANAAINLGLAAVAAPDSLSIRRKIRTEKKKDHFVVRRNNKNEKAAFPKPFKIVPKSAFDEVFMKQDRPNFFVDTGKVATYDHVEIDGVDLPIASSRGIFGQVKQCAWPKCWELNLQRIIERKWWSEQETEKLARELVSLFEKSKEFTETDSASLNYLRKIRDQSDIL